MFAFVFLTALVVASQLTTGEKIDQEGCGQRPLMTNNTRTPQLAIVNGQEAPPNTYPFVCSLQVSSSGWHFCGASLITNKTGHFFVVTAAHCIIKNNIHNEQAMCAIHNNIQTNEEPHKQVLKFSDVQVHEGYNPNTLQNDIAILYLSNQPERNNYTQPACITSFKPDHMEMATVMGWGATSEGGYTSPVLLEVDKPILSKEECQTAYGVSAIDDTMLCAGFEKGDYDACQGDSGGPLVVSRNGTYSLIGVVSWGYGCARPGQPGVYANVDKLRPWISSKINTL